MIRVEKSKKKSKLNSKNLILIILTVVLALVVSVSLEAILHRIKVTENKNKAFYVSQSIQSNILSDFSSYLEILAYVDAVFSDDVVVVSDYLNYEISIFERNRPALHSLQILGEDGYDYTWHKKDCCVATDFSAVHDSATGTFSRVTGKCSLTGPFPIDGRNYFQVVQPVFRKQKSGISEFWGYGVAFLDSGEIFHLTDFDNIFNMGYAYALYNIHPDTGEIRNLLNYRNLSGKDVLSSDFQVSDFIFRLSLYPEHGWVSIFDHIAQVSIVILTALLISVMIWLIYYFSQNEKRLSFYSYIDGLTSLSNARKYFEDLRKIQNSGSCYGILYLDLNDFKPVNDNYGHLVGNQLLSIVAKKLENCIRKSDSAYRIGGDEFSVIVDGAFDREHYILMTDRIRAILEKPVNINGVEINVGVSIGYASCPEDGNTSQEVMICAEEMMYDEKKSRKSSR